MWFGCGSDVVRVVRTWFGCGSDVVRTWFGRGSDAVRMWFGRGSDVVRMGFAKFMTCSVGICAIRPKTETFCRLWLCFVRGAVR
eukprot:6367743-Amphidinium_carterae.1